MRTASMAASLASKYPESPTCAAAPDARISCAAETAQIDRISGLTFVVVTACSRGPAGQPAQACS
jgi:hypothetical protein